MEYLHIFTGAFTHYVHELWFSLALGFLLSGIFHEFVPATVIESNFGDKNLKGILVSAFVGTLLPVCCIGSLPIAMTMRRRGAQLGPILAFLVATPATSIPALIVTWKLLGAAFAVYIFFAVIFMGVLVGIIGNRLAVPVKIKTEGAACCSADPAKSFVAVSARSFPEKILAALRYAFITLPREIGWELILAIALASVLMTVDPAQAFIKKYLSGMMGYLVIIITGLGTYVCCTASVPLADALLKSGMTPGHAMTFLLVGPITSYGTIFVMFREFGGRVLAVYLVLISFLSFLLGFVYNSFPFAK